jgi:hypothetical protein
MVRAVLGRAHSDAKVFENTLPSDHTLVRTRCESPLDSQSSQRQHQQKNSTVREGR